MTSLPGALAPGVLEDNMSRALESRIFHKHPGLVELIGYFTTGADGAVGTTSFPGVTVAKTSEGKYTLTLADKYQSFVGGTVTLMKTTVANALPQFNAASVGTPTVIIDVFTTDRSPNVILDPDSSTIFVTLKVTMSSATRT